MKPKVLFALGFAALVTGVSVLGGGCSSTTETPDGGTGKKVCTPGSYVFCRCASGEDATKLCNEDGETFGPCELGENRPCTETPDPNTGDAAVPQPVDAAIPPTPASEACDGQNIALNPSQEITVNSDTKPAKDDAKGQNACAGGAGAPDHVYALTVPATGRLTATIVPDKAFPRVLCRYYRGIRAKIPSRTTRLPRCINTSPCRRKKHDPFACDSAPVSVFGCAWRKWLCALRPACAC